MIPEGLDVADQQALRTALIAPHEARVRVSLLNLSGDHVSDLTPRFTDGQVNVDATATPTRSVTVTLNDPRQALAIDSDDPSTAAIWRDRMLRVTYAVVVGGDWVSLPVFTGPIYLDGCSRDGRTVTVAAQGLETQAMGACWAPLTIPRGTKKTDAIRTILGERAGEMRFDVPDLPARLPKPLSLHRDAVPWHAARRVARSMGMQLFYDGAGRCRLRVPPDTVGFTFRGEHHVIGAPQVQWSGEVANAVFVVGGVPKGSKTHVHAVAIAPRSHPLSPHRLGRNSVPLYLLPGGSLTRDDTLKTVAEAQARADRELHDGLLQGVDVSFDSLPVPFLDPEDLCHVSTSDLSLTFRLLGFSLPLVAGDGEQSPMSINYHKLVHKHRAAPKHPHIRKRRRR